MLGMKLYMYRTVPLSKIRSSSLYTQQWCTSYMFAESFFFFCKQDQDGTAVLSWSCLQAVSKPVWRTPLLCVQWRTPDLGQRNCPIHEELHSKNKFEKSVYLGAFIIRIYHDARSREHQISADLQGISRKFVLSVASLGSTDTAVCQVRPTRCPSPIFNKKNQMT
jgi:hypothetical protein